MIEGEPPLLPEIQLALAHTRPEHRPALQAVFELDASLGRAVAQASEPIVGQLRLAWWRDALSAPEGQRAKGSPLLAYIDRIFGAGATGLVALVDGWETLLLAEAFDDNTLRSHAQGRAASWLVLARRLSPSHDEDAITAHARTWAIADLAANVRDETQKVAVCRFGARTTNPRRLPRELKGLSILSALARHSLARGGRALMEGRGAALVALRSSLIGR